VTSGASVSVGSGTSSGSLLNVGTSSGGSGVGVTVGVKAPLQILPAVGISVDLVTPLLRK